MLEKLPFYGQVLLFAGLALAIIAAAYYLMPGLGDMKTEITRLEDEYAEKQAKISQGQAIEARLPEFERELAQQEQQLQDLQEILPTETGTDELLRWIKNAGDQSNLELKSFAPGSLRPAEFYKEFPIDMQVTAGYHDLGMFLDEVSNYERIINVDNLRIETSSTGNKTIGATFTATTFVYDEKAQDEEVQ